MKIRQVNALKPRVFSPKVRKSISDLWMLPLISIATKPGLCVGKSLPWKRKGTKVTLNPTQPKPTWVNRCISRKTEFHPTQPDLPILPLKLTCVFIFLKQKSNNSAPFPVYKPPTTLPGMVSGQKEEKKKKHLARLTKLFELTRHLQILKTVDWEREQGGGGGCILANKRQKSMRRHLFTWIMAGVRHTQGGGVSALI